MDPEMVIASGAGIAVNAVIIYLCGWAVEGLLDPGELLRLLSTMAGREDKRRARSKMN